LGIGSISFAAVVLLAGSAVSTQALNDSGVVHVTAQDLEAQVAKTKDGLALNPIPTGPAGPTALIVRRDRAGEVELHETQNDIFVVHAGRAALLVGGQVTGQRLTTPHERRGGVIKGAKSYPMGPGDVLFIPAGLPHQVLVPEGGTFSYLAFKSSK